jgi:uncharacterized protein
MVFINLPVKNLQQSIDFFTALGFLFDPKFTDDKGTCMIINNGASYAMLLTEPFYKTFIKDREVADARKHSETLIALALGSREAVDLMVDTAVAAGGRDYRKEEQGEWMYGRAFEDLDGHIWEAVYMDMTQVPPKTSTAV